MKSLLRRLYERIVPFLRRHLPFQRPPAPRLQPRPQPPPPVTLAPEQWTEEQVTLEGRRIDYRLYVPPLFLGAQTPRSLVLMLHGCQQDPLDFAIGTGMNELARTRNVVLIYPGQRKVSHSHGCWNWFKPQHQQRDRGEPAMLAGLTRAVVRSHGVDPARVYVAGLSAGGSMAAILAECHADLFAAAGVHSGLPRGAANDAISALSVMRHGTKPTGGRGGGRPLIVFQGDADEVVHPDNGLALVESARGLHLTSGAECWRIQGISAQGRHFTRTRHASTAMTGPVEHWELHGVGHAWSGGDPRGSYTDPAGVSASAEMLRFFMENPRRTDA